MVSYNRSLKYICIYRERRKRIMQTNTSHENVLSNFPEHIIYSSSRKLMYLCLQVCSLQCRSHYYINYTSFHSLTTIPLKQNLDPLTDHPWIPICHHISNNNTKSQILLNHSWEEQCYQHTFFNQFYYLNIRKSNT